MQGRPQTFLSVAQTLSTQRCQDPDWHKSILLPFENLAGKKYCFYRFCSSEANKKTNQTQIGRIHLCFLLNLCLFSALERGPKCRDLDLTMMPCTSAEGLGLWVQPSIPGQSLSHRDPAHNQPPKHRAGWERSICTIYPCAEPAHLTGRGNKGERTCRSNKYNFPSGSRAFVHASHLQQVFFFPLWNNSAILTMKCPNILLLYICAKGEPGVRHWEMSACWVPLGAAIAQLTTSQTPMG